MAQLLVENITLTFGGVAALSSVSLAVEEGELVSVIGPNGAGKTSLLNCISGFYHPQRGRILFGGHEITRASPHEVTRLGIARAFQNIELFSGLTVLENLMLARSWRGIGTTCWKTLTCRSSTWGWPKGADARASRR